MKFDNLFIDGSNILNMLYFVNKNNNGTSKELVVIFFTYLNSIYKNFQFDNSFISFDTKQSNEINPRKLINKDYKLNRQTKDIIDKKEDLLPTLKIIEDLLPKTKLHLFNPYSMECDDVISFLCDFFADDKNLIYSNDKDFKQKITKNTIIFNPRKKNFITLKDLEFQPQYFPLFYALVGDTIDNIKGVPKIGEVRALKILTENNFDLIRVVTKLVQYKDLIFENLKLIDLSFYKTIPKEYEYMNIKLLSLFESYIPLSDKKLKFDNLFYNYTDKKLEFENLF